MMKLLISITHIQILFFIFSCTTTKTVENPSVLSEEPIQSVIVPKWSAYQGFFGFIDAKKKCKSIGMRLPTIEELKSANRSKITKSWDKDSSYYWSSTPAGQDSIIICILILVMAIQAHLLRLNGYMMYTVLGAFSRDSRDCLFFCKGKVEGYREEKTTCCA